MGKSRKQLIKAVVLTVGVADCVGIYLVSHRLDNAVSDADRYASVAYTVPVEFPGASASVGAGSVSAPQLAIAPIAPAKAVSIIPAPAVAKAVPASAVLAVAPVAATPHLAVLKALPTPARAAPPAPRTVTAKSDTPASFASLTSGLHRAAAGRTPILEHVVADAAPKAHRARVAKLVHPARTTGFDAAFGGIAPAADIAVNNQLENVLPVLDLAGPNAADVDLAQNQAAMPDVVTQTITPLPTPAAAAPDGELPALSAPVNTPAG